MKENKLTVLDLVDSGDRKAEFEKNVGILKTKVLQLRDLGKESFILESEIKDLANKLVKEFGVNKVELGRTVSWLNDSYKYDELGDILVNSTKELGSVVVNSVDTELSNIPVKLDSGLVKPEIYSDQRVTDLVNTLNVYGNYVDRFDSIDVNDDDNCFDKNKYLISHDLHTVLKNGYKLTRDRVIRKDSGGIYLVVFGSITLKGEDVLVYHYIKYPYKFYETLYNYIKRESSSTVITNDKSIGSDYLFVMRYFFENKEEMVSEINAISNLFKHKYLYGNSRGIYPKNIIDMCKVLLQGCPVFFSDEDICKFIKLVWERKIYDAIVGLIELYGLYTNRTEGLNMLKEKVLKEKVRKTNLDNYNFLSRVVFITDDLSYLIKDIRKSVDRNVNEGLQKWRGQSNSLSHVIDRIDADFRESLNRHNQYPVNVGTIPKDSFIGRSKFSYQNIHKNIGNIRFYSTKRYAKPVVHNYNDIYLDIFNYLKNSPTNKDTQLKMVLRQLCMIILIYLL